MQIHHDNDDNDTDDDNNMMMIIIYTIYLNCCFSSLDIRHVSYGKYNRLKQIQDFATDLP